MGLRRPIVAVAARNESSHRARCSMRRLSRKVTIGRLSVSRSWRATPSASQTISRPRSDAASTRSLCDLGLSVNHDRAGPSVAFGCRCRTRRSPSVRLKPSMDADASVSRCARARSSALEQIGRHVVSEHAGTYPSRQHVLGRSDARRRIASIPARIRRWPSNQAGRPGPDDRDLRSSLLECQSPADRARRSTAVPARSTSSAPGSLRIAAKNSRS